MLVLIDFILDYFPPKAEVRGSNPLGCAIFLFSINEIQENCRIDRNPRNQFGTLLAQSGHIRGRFSLVLEFDLD